MKFHEKIEIWVFRDFGAKLNFFYLHINLEVLVILFDVLF